MRAHPEVDPTLFPAALSLDSFHEYGVATSATSSTTEVVRPLVGGDPKLRVDISVLLWLSETTAYDGGAVLVDDGGAVTRWTGEAGDAIAHSAGARRRIEPVTRGDLLLCMLDVQSFVAGEIERRILSDFSRALAEFERRPPSARHAQTMRRVYHGLIRMWAELPRRPSTP